MAIPAPPLPIPGALQIGTMWPYLALIVIGAVVGARRGWVRELGGLVLLLLLWTVVGFLGIPLVESANRVWLIVRFVWMGGFDLSDPTPLLASLRATPAIDLFAPRTFLGVTFAMGVGLSYLAANSLGPRGSSGGDALLGALAGAITGYIVAYVGTGFFAEALALPGLASRSTIILATVAIVLIVAIAIIANSRFVRRGGNVHDLDEAL